MQQPRFKHLWDKQVCLDGKETVLTQETQKHLLYSDFENFIVTFFKFLVWKKYVIRSNGCVARFFCKLCKAFAFLCQNGLSIQVSTLSKNVFEIND